MQPLCLLRTATCLCLDTNRGGRTQCLGSPCSFFTSLRLRPVASAICASLNTPSLIRLRAVCRARCSSPSIRPSMRPSMRSFLTRFSRFSASIALSSTKLLSCSRFTVTPSRCRWRLSQRVMILSVRALLGSAWRKRRDEPSTEASTSRRHCPQPRALSAEERAHMLEIAHSEPYRDQPVYEIYHDLLQQGIYLGSLSTWYRQLREAKESGDRRPQRAPQHHAVPRITARAANEAWTWDISKLPTRRRGVYLNLYVVLDLYSRFIVAWMVPHKENAALAQQLF